MVVFDPYPTVPLSEFRDELLFEFRKLPAELFDYYLVRTARDMAQKAPILRRTAMIEMEPCVTRYSLETPDGMRFQSILEARLLPDGNVEHGGRELRRLLAPPQTDSKFAHVCWYVPEEKVFVVHVPETGPRPWVRVVMSVLPERNACELPECYRQEFFDALMMGTRAQIMMITGRPWTNLQVGMTLYNTYETMLSDAALQASLHGQSGVIKMRHGRVL